MFLLTTWGHKKQDHYILYRYVSKQLCIYIAGGCGATSIKDIPILLAISLNAVFIIYLDSREGDGRGGIGADHQRHDSRTQSTKHVWELRGQRSEETRHRWYNLSDHKVHLDLSSVKVTNPVRM